MTYVNNYLIYDENYYRYNSSLSSMIIGSQILSQQCLQSLKVNDSPDPLDFEAEDIDNPFYLPIILETISRGFGSCHELMTQILLRYII